MTRRTRTCSLPPELEPYFKSRPGTLFAGDASRPCTWRKQKGWIVLYNSQGECLAARSARLVKGIGVVLEDNGFNHQA